MALKARKGCKTCELIKAGDKSLEKRINNSKQWTRLGEPLTTIHADYEDKLTYLNLYNHAKKHQAPSEKALALKRGQEKLRELNDEKALEIGKAISHHDARKELTALGVDKIKEGEIKMTAAAVVALLKQEMDIEEKAKDRTAEMMKMFNFYASGEAVHRGDVVEGEVVE